MIEQHSGGAPLFIYLAFQSIHSPIEAPEEWVAPYGWITDLSRRKMAGMASCMDAEIARIKDAMVAKQFWDDTLFVFGARFVKPSALVPAAFLRHRMHAETQRRTMAAHLTLPTPIGQCVGASGASPSYGAVQSATAIFSPPRLVHSRARTIWEGGTHLTGFAHGFGLPAKVGVPAGLGWSCL